MAHNPDKDNKAIEKRALRSLEDFIDRSKIISSYLDDNDKTPSWDGHLYLFSDKKDKNHFKGRVPVQVKGTEVKQFKLNNFKFPIEVNDLKAYLHEPTVYIVCQEKENSSERLLFYRRLLPETIKPILKGKEKQTKINVLMHVFPQKLNDFEDQMLVFLSDSKKQISFADNQKVLSLNEITKRGIKNYTFSSPSNNMNEVELLKYLSITPTYLYVKIDKELNIQMPVSGGRMIFEFETKVNKDIFVGGKKFFDEFTFKIKEGKTYVSISNIITIIIDDENTITTTKAYVEFNYLKDSIRKAEFLIAINDVGTINIGGQEFNIKINEKELIDKLSNILPEWKAFQNILDKLHVEKDLDIRSIKKEETPIIKALIKTIGEGKLVELGAKESSIYFAEISNIKILLLLTIDSSGKCMLSDFFNNKTITYIMNNTKKVEVTSFTYLRNNFLWKDIDNIPYEEIMPSYIALSKKNKYIYRIANDDLLSILKAYDFLKNKDEQKSEHLLNIANQINSWLIENDSLKNQLTNLINYYQIIKRQRNLDHEEINKLSLYLKNKEVPYTYKVAICLLLDNTKEFSIWIKKCTKEEINIMKNYPIWIFKK